MKAYIIHHRSDWHDYDWVLGIASTREKANAMITKWARNKRKEQTTIKLERTRVNAYDIGFSRAYYYDEDESECFNQPKGTIIDRDRRLFRIEEVEMDEL